MKGFNQFSVNTRAYFIYPAGRSTGLQPVRNLPYTLYNLQNTILDTLIFQKPIKMNTSEEPFRGYCIIENVVRITEPISAALTN